MIYWYGYIYCTLYIVHYTDDNLSVEVDATDNESDGVVYDDEDAARAQAKINSPKGQNGMNFNEDEDGGNQGGMSLNLGNVSDDDGYEDDKVTPNTKRDQMDVNSPRNKTKQVIIYYHYAECTKYII